VANIYTRNDAVEFALGETLEVLYARLIARYAKPINGMNSHLNPPIAKRYEFIVLIELNLPF